MARLDCASRVPKPPESEGGVALLAALTDQAGLTNLFQGFHNVGWPSNQGARLF